jgi:hypothetical protein
MDDACLDDDTSGDETKTENMSVSGDPHPHLLNISTLGNPTSDKTVTGSSRFHQDSSMGATMISNTGDLNSSPHCEPDKIFSIFDKKKPPPIPAKINRSKNTQASETLPTNSKLEFRPQHDTIRAAKLRQLNMGILGSMGGFTRITDEEQKMVGFDVKGDTRQFVAKNVHDTTGGRNISTSLDP